MSLPNFEQHNRMAARMVAFEDQTEDVLEIPEDLSALSDDELQELADQATAAFDEVYGDGDGLSDEALGILTQLTEGIEAISTVQAERAEADAERRQKAAELAARVKPQADAGEDSEEDAEASAEDVEAAGEDTVAETAEVDAQVEPVAASGGPVRVPLSTVKRGKSSNVPAPAPEPTVSDIMSVADVPGFARGEGLDWLGVGKAVDQRLNAFNLGQYQAAAGRGQHLRERLGVAVIRRQIPDHLQVSSTDSGHIAEVIDRAVNEAALPKGSLVASGGWCAPSETTYDMLELESTDGLLSAPEIGINRGGIQHTQGIDFSDIFSGTGFSYTEDEDAAGDYDGEGGGTKPCYTVDCPDFTDVRLQLEGLCIQAGLLQSRGYPEVIARTTRGALVAHAHRLSGKKIAAIAAGSTAVTFAGDAVGSTAPLLDAIEKQAEHMRYVHRLARGATIEAIFPFWVRGVIRGDLARRLGVDLIDVPDARIDGWIRGRGINPQFVYNYQDLTGDAAAFTNWPSTVKFLMYPAGTWVMGGADVLTIDTIYDSVGLGTNDYTALWTEEGWLALKRFNDSREVTVPVCISGATAGGILVDCDGTAADPEAG